MSQQPLKTTFDPQAYGPAVEQLLRIEAPYPLVPTRPVEAAQDALAALDEALLFTGKPVTNRDLADACRSGLWLWFDFLDESHEISQNLKTSTGSFWHGIMHRREPDYSNAKYWFRQTGHHPVFDDLLSAIAARHGDQTSAGDYQWDPFRFVDDCEQAADEGGDFAESCQRISVLEWQLLFDYCYQQAVG